VENGVSPSHQSSRRAAGRFTHGTLPYDTGRRSVKRLWDRCSRGVCSRASTGVIALTTNEAAEARAIWSAWSVPLPDERISVVPNGIHVSDSRACPIPPRSARGGISAQGGCAVSWAIT